MTTNITTFSSTTPLLQSDLHKPKSDHKETAVVLEVLAKSQTPSHRKKSKSLGHDEPKKPYSWAVWNRKTENSESKISSPELIDLSEEIEHFSFDTPSYEPLKWHFQCEEALRKSTEESNESLTSAIFSKFVQNYFDEKIVSRFTQAEWKEEFIQRFKKIDSPQKYLDKFNKLDPEQKIIISKIAGSHEPIFQLIKNQKYWLYTIEKNQRLYKLKQLEIKAIQEEIWQKLFLNLLAQKILLLEKFDFKETFNLAAMQFLHIYVFPRLNEAGDRFKEFKFFHSLSSCDCLETFEKKINDLKHNQFLMICEAIESDSCIHSLINFETSMKSWMSKIEPFSGPNKVDAVEACFVTFFNKQKHLLNVGFDHKYPISNVSVEEVISSFRAFFSLEDRDELNKALIINDRPLNLPELDKNTKDFQIQFITSLAEELTQALGGDKEGVAEGIQLLFQPNTPIETIQSRLPVLCLLQSLSFASYSKCELTQRECFPDFFNSELHLKYFSENITHYIITADATTKDYSVIHKKIYFLTKGSSSNHTDYASLEVHWKISGNLTRPDERQGLIEYNNFSLFKNIDNETLAQLMSLIKEV